MINKFQQGGKQDPIIQFVLQLASVLQADPNLIVQIAQQNPQALEAAVQTYQQTQDIQLAAQTFLLTLLKLTQIARHGAKLQYLKSLKNQCAEDEEIVYYKKGGSVECGCVKKSLLSDNKETWRDKFNKVKKASSGMGIEKKEITYYRDTTSKDSVKAKSTQKKEGWNKNNFIVRKKEIEKRKKQLKSNKTEEETTPPTINKGINKNCSGAKMKLIKKGDKVCPKCGKIHSAGMGCAVAAFKNRNK